mgnify:CR=1 FL=1
MKSIYGLGSDIANINRMKSILKRNKSFKKRIFSSSEIYLCEKKKNSHSCFAKRFAAKEAFSKALGTGISRGINFDEIIVYNIKSGKPRIKLFGNTKKVVNKILNKKKFNIFLSLSDDKPFAVATVVISL